MADWSPAVYLKFENERTRAAIDLLAQVPLDRVARAVDVGCGPGNSTELLALRYPDADLLGLDNSPAMLEANDLLLAQGIELDLIRVRGFPFNDDVRNFVDTHDEIFVVEQNRDGQMRTLLVNELDADPKKLKRVLHYNGSPITARMISETIAAFVPATTTAA